MCPLHDYNLANQTPASYRTDHNNLNLAIAGNNASSSGITTTFSHMWYADVSSSGWMRQRNAADSTHNYLYFLGAAGGLCTYAGNPSTNHIGRFVGQEVYDTSNNVRYYCTLAGTSSQATWSAIASSSAYNTTTLPKNYMQGLVPKYATSNTLTISSGVCRDDSDAANISFTSQYTVDITVSGAGGLSTSETESTSGAWYYCFAIYKTTDGTVNFMLTNSSSGPVFPSGYDKKRLLPFAIRNTTQANFLPWAVAGGWPSRPTIQYQVQVSYSTVGPSNTAGITSILANSTQTSFTAASCTSYVPPISRMANFHGIGPTGNFARIRTTGDTNDYGIAASQAFNICNFPTSTAQSIDYLVTGGGVYLDVTAYTVTEL